MTNEADPPLLARPGYRHRGKHPLVSLAIKGLRHRCLGAFRLDFQPVERGLGGHRKVNHAKEKWKGVLRWNRQSWPVWAMTFR